MKNLIIWAIAGFMTIPLILVAGLGPALIAKSLIKVENLAGYSIGAVIGFACLIIALILSIKGVS